MATITSNSFFSRKEVAAINTFIGDLTHERRTRAHLLARCADDPIRVLDYFRRFVTREDFAGNEILQKISGVLRKEGFGHKIRFKASGRQTRRPLRIPIAA